MNASSSEIPASARASRATWGYIEHMDPRPPQPLAAPAGTPLAGRLPSGRELAVTSTPRGEQIEVRSPAGDLELRIALTDQGPVLLLRGVRLEIDSTDAVSLRCKELDIHAAGGIRLASGGDVSIAAQGEARIRTQGQAYIDAEVLNLNGGDRSAYPDGQPGYVPPVFKMPEVPPPPPPGPHACGHDH